MRRFPMTRFIPQDSTPVTRDGIQAIAYLYSKGGKPHAIAYRGKANRPALHFSYRSEESRSEHVERFFTGAKLTQETKAARRQERAEQRKAGHGAIVGTIFYTSWGYEQTNVDFFEVVKFTHGSITVRQIEQDCKETGFMCGHATPRPGKFAGGEQRSMFTGRGFKHDGHSLMLWDGKPKYSSWYA
jgi:hypothetical protein